MNIFFGVLWAVLSTIGIIVGTIETFKEYKKEKTKQKES